MMTLLTIIAAIDIEKTLIPILVAVMSSGFLFGLFKVLPERKSILVAASENAVKVVNDAIGTLQKELAEARAEILRLETELISAKAGREKLEFEVGNLRLKVAKLEAELDIYSRLAGHPTHDRRKDDEHISRNRENDFTARSDPELEDYGE